MEMQKEEHDGIDGLIMALLATTWSPETAKTSAASSIEGGAFSG